MTVDCGDSVIFPPGTIFDERFVIIRLLGEGGMGQVYKAKQIGLERIVALKVLLPGTVQDSENGSRFEREGQVLSELNHPNIPAFYHFGIWNQQFAYIAMEYLEGKTLRDLILTGPIPWQHCLKIAVQVCEAVEHAHRYGFLHRDLKPNNIMLVDSATTDLVVKVVDFGLAGLVSNTESDQLTGSGVLIGTVYYMSPEVCRGGKPDPRSDVYALGCILYESIAGLPPFSDQSPIALIHKHVTASPPSLSNLLKNGAIPEGLEDIVCKAMTKAPEARYGSMKELAEDLMTVLQGRCPDARKTRVYAPRKRNFVRLAVIFVVVSTIVAAFILKQSARQSVPTIATSSIADRRAILVPVSGLLLLQQAWKLEHDWHYEQANQMIDNLICSRASTRPPEVILCLAHLQKARSLFAMRGPQWREDHLKDKAINKLIERECYAAIAFAKKPDGKLYRPVADAYRRLGDIEEVDPVKAVQFYNKGLSICDEPLFPLDREFQEFDFPDLKTNIRFAIFHALQRIPGGHKQAAQFATEILAGQPNDSEWNSLLASLYASDGEVVQAERIMRSVVLRHPDDHDAVTGLLNVLFLAGKKAEANLILAKIEQKLDRELAEFSEARKNEDFSGGNFARFAFSPTKGSLRTITDQQIHNRGVQYFELAREECDRLHYRNGLRLYQKSIPFLDLERYRDLVLYIDYIRRQDPEISTECDSLKTVVQERIRATGLH